MSAKKVTTKVVVSALALATLLLVLAAIMGSMAPKKLAKPKAVTLVASENGIVTGISGDDVVVLLDNGRTVVFPADGEKFFVGENVVAHAESYHTVHYEGELLYLFNQDGSRRWLVHRSQP